MLVKPFLQLILISHNLKKKNHPTRHEQGGTNYLKTNLLKQIKNIYILYRNILWESRLLSQASGLRVNQFIYVVIYDCLFQCPRDRIVTGANAHPKYIMPKKKNSKEANQCLEASSRITSTPIAR